MKLCKSMVAIMLIFILALSVGCQPQKKPQQEQRGKPKPVVIERDLAAQAKEAAKSVEGVEEVTAVVVDHSISAAIKVTGFKRLQLGAIKREVDKRISLLDPEGDYKVYVTADKKLFKQLQEIEKQIEENNIKDEQSLKQQVEKINDAMKG